MKNRIILFVTLSAFAIFAFLYTKGNNASVSPPTSWTNAEQDSDAAGISVTEEPSADNVSTSYFDKVEQLENYLSNNPEDTTHILRLARLYQEGHQAEKASVWYEKYLTLVPTDIQSLLDLANTYGEAGNWDGALEVTDRLLKIEPNNGKALYNKAAIHANMGQFDEAKSAWELIVTNNDDDELVRLSNQALDKLSNM